VGLGEVEDSGISGGSALLVEFLRHGAEFCGGDEDGAEVSAAGGVPRAALGVGGGRVLFVVLRGRGRSGLRRFGCKS
jgi:hypothetical protein